MVDRSKPLRIQIYDRDIKAHIAQEAERVGLSITQYMISKVFTESPLAAKDMLNHVQSQ